jgi:protein required for attachment to host cells
VAKRFARRIAKALETGSSKRKIDDLVIAAEPRFLGILREELPSSVRQVIRHEIRHDYLHKSDAELRQLILDSIRKA